MKKISILFLCALLIFTGCASSRDNAGRPPQSTGSEENSREVQAAEPFADLRGGLRGEGTLSISPDEYVAADIPTYTFNQRTVFESNQELQQEILELGKNPGLGVRALHEQGITGKGVSVAIIDQNLFLESPEFAPRIAEYYECEFDFSGTRGSMHGPAVASILAGETTGVAPEVTVYYAAAPSWTGDSAYCANGLNWVIDRNETLPEGEKIRLVSVSAAPSGEGSPFEENLEQWDAAVERAQAAGILVLDCRYGYDTCFVSHGFYDLHDPDNLESVRNGWAAFDSTFPTEDGFVTAPCDFRTTVEQYDAGDYFFRYGGSGGLSWGVPYAAGVLALGWQVNPQLSAEEMRALLLESAYVNAHDERIIHPAAFIAAVEATL